MSTIETDRVYRPQFEARVPFDQKIFARNTSGRGICADLSLKEQLQTYEKTYYSYSTACGRHRASRFVHHGGGKTSPHHDHDNNTFRND
jgi:hypothetical protein